MLFVRSFLWLLFTEKDISEVKSDSGDVGAIFVKRLPWSSLLREEVVWPWKQIPWKPNQLMKRDGERE